MSNAQHYKSNLRDIFFNLFEVLDIDKTILGKGEYAGQDEETVRATLEASTSSARRSWRRAGSASDRVPLTLDADGNVHLPEPLKRSLKAHHDNEWHLMGLPERLGGTARRRPWRGRRSS